MLARAQLASIERVMVLGLDPAALARPVTPVSQF
jgi:hypothetical protein